MNQRIILTAFICLAIVANSQLPNFTNNDAVQAAQINLALPNLKFYIGDNWISMANGASIATSTYSYHHATLRRQILNSDFNDDGLIDAAVILNVVSDSISGYMSDYIFVVLQNYTTGPILTNGIPISYNIRIDTFSTDLEGKKIIIQYKDRLPQQSKVHAPSIPTLVKLKLDATGKLVQESKTQSTLACYPF